MSGRTTSPLTRTAGSPSHPATSAVTPHNCRCCRACCRPYEPRYTSSAALTTTLYRHPTAVTSHSAYPTASWKVAAEAIEEAAYRKNDPADLINIALERLVEGSYELPAFRTLNDMAATI